MHPSTKGVRGRRHQVTPHLDESAGSWKQLQQRYLSSTLSLRALAREAGVSYDPLKRRARREQWATQRAADVCTARRRRDLEELARARAEAVQAARALLMLPERAAPGRVAEAARAAREAATLLAGLAMHVARLRR